MLTSIAQQKGMDPAPVRMERGEEHKRSHSIEGGNRTLKGRVGRDKRSDQREYYELESDHNALLVGVLGRLDDDGPLADNLDEIGAAPMLDQAMLDQLINAARSTQGSRLG